MIAARAIAILGTLAVAAPPLAAAPAIEGTWRVAAIGGAEVPAGAGIVVTFAAGEISGETGCNRFSGTYALTSGRLDMGPIRATKRGCKPDAATRESSFLRALGTAMRIETAADGLVLHGPAGERLALVRG